MRRSAAYRVTSLSGLGFTTERRNASTSTRFDDSWDFSKLNGREETLIRAGELIDGSTTQATAVEMHKIVLATLDQTEHIAARLKASGKEQTLRNIANYFKNFYNYSLDRPDREQLRTPVRAFADRFEGIDCDCFAISVSSILLNLGIDHYWRKTKTREKGDFTHIYVVVPKMKGLSLNSRGNYWVIDPVVGKFDHEHTNNRVPEFKEDFHVTLNDGMGLSLSFKPSFNPAKIALVTTALILTGIGLHMLYKQNKNKRADV